MRFPDNLLKDRVKNTTHDRNLLSGQERCSEAWRERNRSNFSGTGNLQIAQVAGRSLGVFPVFFVLGVDTWALQSFGAVGIAKGAAGIWRKIF
jgi:hypothetical protein